MTSTAVSIFAMVYNILMLVLIGWLGYLVYLGASLWLILIMAFCTVTFCSIKSTPNKQSD